MSNAWASSRSGSRASSSSAARSGEVAPPEPFLTDVAQRVLEQVRQALPLGREAVVTEPSARSPRYSSTAASVAQSGLRTPSKRSVSSSIRASGCNPIVSASTSRIASGSSPAPLNALRTSHNAWAAELARPRRATGRWRGHPATVAGATGRGARTVPGRGGRSAGRVFRRRPRPRHDRAGGRGGQRPGSRDLTHV